jgi:hypothetical protein
MKKAIIITLLFMLAIFLIKKYAWHQTVIVPDNQATYIKALNDAKAIKSRAEGHKAATDGILGDIK